MTVVKVAYFVYFKRTFASIDLELGLRVFFICQHKGVFTTVVLKTPRLSLSSLLNVCCCLVL